MQYHHKTFKHCLTLSRVIKHDDDCSENKMANYLLLLFNKTKAKFLTIAVVDCNSGCANSRNCPQNDGRRTGSKFTWVSFWSLIVTAGFIYLFIWCCFLLYSTENCPRCFVVLCFSASSPPLLHFIWLFRTPQLFWNSTWWLHKQKRGFPHQKEKPAMKATVKVKSVGTFQDDIFWYQ